MLTPAGYIPQRKSNGGALPMSLSCLGKAICVLIGALILASVPTAAQTQSSLSEKLKKSIDANRRVERGNAENVNEEARKAYESVLGDEADATPERRRIALKSRAWVHEQANELDRAEADYTAALRMEPADVGDYADRGYFYLRTGRYGDAINDFDTGARLAPSMSRYRFAIGRVHAAMRNYHAAVEFYGEAIRINSRDAVAFLSRAEAEVHLKKYTSAKSDYDRAIAIGLRRPTERLFAYLGRGYVALMNEDLDAAASDFEAALDSDPTYLNAWLWLGCANERRGRLDLAIDAYERALMIEPGNVTIGSRLRRLRSKEPSPSDMPDFQIDDRARLVAEMRPGIVPRRRPQL
jgi:tetratricopeptide (TPR) repeat protein